MYPQLMPFGVMGGFPLPGGEGEGKAEGQGSGEVRQGGLVRAEPGPNSPRS